MTNLKKQGDPAAFDSNWKMRSETHYNHFTLGSPKNQIQLAFRSHYEVFSEILTRYPTLDKTVLETGCGRGTLSNYFAVNGWDVTLLDYNQSVLDVAKNIFVAQNLDVKIIKGDALSLGIPDNTYDVVTNIGLLEHFEEIKTVMDEQLRVLKPGGWCLSYVVPERPDNVQRYFNWINVILKFFSLSWIRAKAIGKPEVYRSDNYSDRYLSCIDDELVERVITHGMYPLPMISHSPEFPFSLLPRPFEFVLVCIFRVVLRVRSVFTKKHGWVCSEKNGQAFLVAFQKK